MDWNTMKQHPPATPPPKKRKEKQQTQTQFKPSMFIANK